MSAEAERGGVPSGTLLAGRYRVSTRLGAGGLGVVYEGVDVSLGRAVAVKVLHRDVAAVKELRRRFEREARALAALTHPHIVSISDFGVHDEVPFLVMERLTGTTLDTLIADAGPFPPTRALAIATQIVRALAFAHARGVVHRDLKPSNVFVMQQEGVEDHVKVIDFGLAKFLETDEGEPTLTQAGAVFGTPAYMAPEQASGGRCDARTDVYSAGVLLFELLTGRRPFLGTTRVEVIRGHLIEPPPTLAAARPDLVASPELEQLVARTLAKAPKERPADAAALLEALEALPEDAAHLDPRLRPSAAVAELRHEGLDTVAGSAGAQRRAELLRRIDAEDRRRRWLFGLGGVSALAAASAVAWWLVARAPVPGSSDASVETTRGQAGIDDGDPGPSAGPPAGAPDATAAGDARTPGAATTGADAAARALPTDAGASPPGLSVGDAGRGDASILAGGGGGEEPADDGAAGADPAGERLPLGPGPTLPSPWSGEVPDLLLRYHRKLRAGSALVRGEQQELFRYVRGHRRDPRAQLLYARSLARLGHLTDAVDRFEVAFELDDAVKGDPSFLAELLRILQREPLRERAGALVERAYGRRAVAAIDALLGTMDEHANEAYPLRALRRRLLERGHPRRRRER